MVCCPGSKDRQQPAESGPAVPGGGGGGGRAHISVCGGERSATWRLWTMTWWACLRAALCYHDLCWLFLFSFLFLFVFFFFVFSFFLFFLLVLLASAL